VFGIQCGASGVFGLCFLLFSGFQEVRALVYESLADYAPSLARSLKREVAG
jgi:hypothetical protein